MRQAESKAYIFALAALITVFGSGCMSSVGSKGDPAESINQGAPPLENNKCVTPVAKEVAVLTDRASVTVPEGSTVNFAIKLSAPPADSVLIAVTRTSGDPNITVSKGAGLIFTTGNWAACQTVTLAATEDNSDTLNGTASITCNGLGIVPAVVTAAETDDDYTLTVTSPYGTVTRTPDVPYYDKGTSVSLKAAPNGPYLFKNWAGDLAGTNNPVSITVDGKKSITANYVAQPTEGPPESILPPLREIYDTETVKIGEGFMQCLSNVRSKYGTTLEAKRVVLQKDGDLQNLVTVTNEIRRFAVKQMLPPKADATLPAFIVSLGNQYWAEYESYEAIRRDRMAGLQVRYTNRLAALVKALTQEGEIDAALALQEEIKRIASAMPPPPVTQVFPASPTTTLVRTTPPPNPPAPLDYWKTESSGKRHNNKCRYYQITDGAPCGKNDGTPCSKCGG
jgi:hypothetical protein